MAKFFAVSYSNPGKSIASMTGISQANLDGFKLIELKYDGEKNIFVGYWTSGTFTDSTYNAFPTGSIVFDFVGHKIYFKEDATTWTDVALT